MDKIKVNDLSLKSYLDSVAKKSNTLFEEIVINEHYRFTSRTDPQYKIDIFTYLPSRGLSIAYVNFGDISFNDATDSTYRLIIDKLIQGDYKIYDTPVNKYLKYIFFFIESNSKSIQFYDNGSEIHDFDYRTTGNSYPLSYYRRWPDIKNSGG